MNIENLQGKKQLAGDTVREATSDEVKELRAENSELKTGSQQRIRSGSKRGPDGSFEPRAGVLRMVRAYSSEPPSWRSSLRASFSLRSRMR